MTNGNGEDMQKSSGTRGKKKRGRPSKFDTVSLEQVEVAGRLGGTDEDVAILLNIHISTLHEYKKHPEFSDALKKGKVVADNRIVASLYQRGLGYNFTEETQELVGGQMVVTKRVTKHIPADVAAAFIWLKNRRPAEWRQVHEWKPAEKKYEDPFLELARLLDEAGITLEAAVDRRPSSSGHSEPQ
jgi:hypothetical protein